MELPKEFGGQWIPATPAKPIPFGLSNEAEMPCMTHLALNSPAINGGGIGRKQGMNAEILNWNRFFFNGKISSPANWESGSSRGLPPLSPKSQYRAPFPFSPNLNSLPEYNNASRVFSEQMASPATPATMEKNQRQRIQDHLPCEIIDLDPIDEPTSFHDLLRKKSEKPREIIDLDSVDEPTASYQDLLWNECGKVQQEQCVFNQGERNMVLNSAEEVIVQQAEGDNQGIDLNKTPPPKTRRKKYTPKVIREGKPARTPKKPATPKPPMTAENAAGKRKYVRKKKDGSPQENATNAQEAPKSAPGQIVNDDNRNRNKTVRRSLNFNSEDTQAVDPLAGSGSMAFRHNVLETQGQEAQNVSQTVVRSQTASAVHCSQGQGSVILERPIGGFNNSTSRFTNENLRTPQILNQALESSRQEMLKLKWQVDFERMRSNMNSNQQSARREGNWERHGQDGQRHGQDGQNQVASNTNSMSNIVHKVQVGANMSLTQENYGSSIDPCFRDIHKRRKVENGQRGITPYSSSMSALTPSGWKATQKMQNTSHIFIPYAQRRMPLEQILSQKHMLEIAENEREKSYREVQIDRPILTPMKQFGLDKINSIQPPTPEKTLACNNSHENGTYGPRARVDLLITKQKKPRGRRQKNKEQDPDVNLLTKNANQIVSYRDPIEEIVQKLRDMDINGAHEIVSIQQQSAIVPYVGGSGTMVLFEGPIDLIKKRKPRPKVDLDPESDRVWKLLMGKESNEGENGTDMEKEKWWEEERRVFRGRADSFIARMHLIQGDRRFSRWKGSVVDSVIGVFLTQNVSDHLSSSAFMCLAARFPPQLNGTVSRPMFVDDTIRHQGEATEPEICDQRGINGSKQKQNNETANSNESLESSLGSSATISSCTSAVEGNNRKSLEDVVSSQNSVASSENSSVSPVKTTDQSKLSPPLNFEAAELLTGGRDHGFGSFRELLEMADEGVLNDLKDTGNGSMLLGGDDSMINWSIALRMDKSLSAPNGPIDLNGSCPSIDTPFSHIHPEFQKFSTSRFVGMDKSEAINENNMSYLPPTAFELNERNINELMGRHYASGIGSSINSMNQNQPLIDTIAPCANSFGGISKDPAQPLRPLQNEGHSCFQNGVSYNKNVSDICLNQQDGSGVMLKKREKLAETQTSSNSHNTNQRHGFVSEGAEGSNLRSHKVSSKTQNKISKEKNAKAETEKKTYDWDCLRKQVYGNGAKKERNSDAMDSLDYEALRNANVNEISNTIRERGMNNLLAERIKDFLNRLVRDHGSIDLEWLRDIPPDKAKDYLLSIRGLGLKSVECVRLLTLHHLAFPVDTNVGRIAVRLGWVPLQPLPESLQLHLLEMYPILETIQKYLWPRLCKLDQRTLYELHYQLITFGKVFCTKSKPNCNACPMRGECRHFASAFASARLALPGPEEKRLVSSTTPFSSERSHGPVPRPLPLPQHESSTHLREQIVPRNCEPIIEEPATPEPECIKALEIDIEDAFYNDPDEIPGFKLNMEEFSQNLQSYVQDGDMSKALVALTPEAASIPVPKLKNVNRLRTEHQVYELPDSHRLLEGLDKREADDPCPYLLAIWTPGETAQSIEPPTACCNTQDTGKLCFKDTCFSCNSIREAQAQMVRGTLLIPCRTANRGSFPLNGTYFQVNEVFADHESSRNPIEVPRDWIWNLPRRTVYFGTSVSSIFKGLTTEGIQYCFWRGFVCVRGFDRTLRAPRPLFARLHIAASKVIKTKRTGAEARNDE
ncbi:uncharacterized protein A4U43_C10F15150 [Asparagus officinalis]|uniref:HhH-GPD domain-containing protein n=1 Tax=Asparagus officinalis TaxID=4686 RepID=A0A5P1E2X7_ASPOF|nr:transcriptional activator DEMETER-like [Asparagus officinalis]XP_020247936.1 transcriptional activator DEMETER-like [Asparagus officinalis]XP_020247937.1 transcriptional activator DEMETER-like [Asparagus officinalis]ONK56964.1 uncharacterized protein A4U43_C10F15150 [Asparagus officinalis]